MVSAADRVCVDVMRVTLESVSHVNQCVLGRYLCKEFLIENLLNNEFLSVAVTRVPVLHPIPVLAAKV